MLSDNNAITLHSYDAGIKEYVEKSPAEVTEDFKPWVDKTLALLAKSARIFEIGSGFGRDARYMESHGFNVQRSDAALGFVTFLKKEGYDAHLFNAVTDDFGGPYDLIFANAVFLHFTQEELEKILVKTRASLSPNGLLSFSIKQGQGEEWESVKLGHPRYFRYWRCEDMITLLNFKGFAVLETFHNAVFSCFIAQVY
ncbi:MAG TPA: class I SAM-dependent methyltransferase [Rhabdochlamydiaceae bacterium]|jgi:predicted TPR repeat methyltransferase